MNGLENMSASETERDEVRRKRSAKLAVLGSAGWALLRLAGSEDRIVEDETRLRLRRSLFEALEFLDTSSIYEG